MAAPKNPVGPKSDKIWRDAVMRAVRRIHEDGDAQALERLADTLVAKGLEGDTPALKEIGDRLDGKPSQESTVTLTHKHDATDWTRDELVAFLNNASNGGDRASKTEGRPKRPDRVH